MPPYHHCRLLCQSTHTSQATGRKPWRSEALPVPELHLFRRTKMALIPSATICFVLASIPPQGNTAGSRGLQQRGGEKRETPEVLGEVQWASDTPKWSERRESCHATGEGAMTAWWPWACHLSRWQAALHCHGQCVGQVWPIRPCREVGTWGSFPWNPGSIKSQGWSSESRVHPSFPGPELIGHVQPFLILPCLPRTDLELLLEGFYQNLQWSLAESSWTPTSL